MSRTHVVIDVNKVHTMALFLKEEEFTNRGLSRKRSILVKAFEGLAQDFEDWLNNSKDELIKKHCKLDDDGNPLFRNEEGGREVVDFLDKDHGKTFNEEYGKCVKESEAQVYDVLPSQLEAMIALREYYNNEENEEASKPLSGAMATAFDEFMDMIDDIIDNEDDPSEADKKSDKKK